MIPFAVLRLDLLQCLIRHIRTITNPTQKITLATVPTTALIIVAVDMLLFNESLVEEDIISKLFCVYMYSCGETKSYVFFNFRFISVELKRNQLLTDIHKRKKIL